MELRSLQSYVSACREAIRSIRVEIERFSGSERDHEILARIRRRLVKICRDADSHQFDDLYQIALAIQKQLLDLDHGIQKWSVDLASAIDDGLAMLSVLLEECEDEFRRRLKVSDVLKQLSQPAK